MTVHEAGGAGGLKWQVETLRLTALFPSSEPKPLREHWDTVVQEEPDSVNIRKGIMETRIQGPFHGAQLSLLSTPERVDWILSRPASPDDEMPLPTVGEFADSLGPMADIAATWGAWEGCPSFQRIALGAVLLSPTEGRESGYRELQPYLPDVVLDPANSRDLLYQINRRRTIKWGELDLEINRLSKWSVAVLGTAALIIADDRLKATGGEKMHVCRLELDVNTVPEFEGEFSRSEIPVIFDRLRGLAVEVSERGDRP